MYIQELLIKLAFGTLFAALIIYFVIFIIGKEIHPKTERFNIVSCSLQKESNGTFILGTGELSDNVYYAAYKVNKDGGKEYYKMNAKTSIIYDQLEEGETSYVEEDRDAVGIKQIRIYVPKGTIIEKVDLDLAG